MRPLPVTAHNIVPALACLLVCKTVVAVLLTFPDYFPPNFGSEFLQGREAYFFGPYQWAFYVHIVSGPLVLLSGLVLLSDSARRRFPAWHRRLGKTHIACVLLLVTRSGLWMARYAFGGAVAATGFTTLAVLTAVCAANGWRAAVAQRFDRHRVWMQRCYALLCSAVVIRVIGGVSQVLALGWTYPYAAWLSWLSALIVLEAARFIPRSVRRPQWSAWRGVSPGRYPAEVCLRARPRMPQR